MSTQLAFRLGSGRAVSLDEQFDAWIRTTHGQEVYLAVIARAFRLQRAGVTHYGIGAICEAIRFSWTIRRGPDTWKVNNNWRSRMARLAMTEYPALEGFFETRELRS
jgi:hypothetical protein